MKIVLFQIFPIEVAGGCEKYFVELAATLRERNHHVVIAGSSPLFMSLVSAFYTVFNSVTHRMPRLHKIVCVKRELGGTAVRRLRLAELLPFTKARGRFVRLLAEADVIYCKNEWLDLAALRMFLPVDMLSKVILGAHSATFIDPQTARTPWGRIHNLLYEGQFYRRQIRAAAAIHTPNRSDAERIASFYGVSEQRVAFIPYPLADTAGSGSTAAAPAVAAGAPLRLLFAQRLTQQKGLDYLAELIDALSADACFSQLRFTIAGATGGYDALATSLAERFPNVTYLGYISDMASLYEEHDIVIVPSWWETFSGVTIEAQAAARPVIAFDIPGPNGIIVDGATGWLLPLGDIAGLAELVRTLVRQYQSDPDALRAMGDRGREHVLARFGRDVVMRQMVDLMAAVAPRGRQTGPSPSPPRDAQEPVCT